MRRQICNRNGIIGQNNVKIMFPIALKKYKKYQIYRTVIQLGTHLRTFATYFSNCPEELYKN
jgi:hypothetical protein